VSPAAIEPGVAIAIVVVVVTIASGLVYAAVGGALGRWREEINKPRSRPRDRDPDADA
jgi:hypothetical protein